MNSTTSKLSKTGGIIMIIIGAMVVGMNLVNNINSSGTLIDLLASSANGILIIALGLFFLVLPNMKKKV